MPSSLPLILWPPVLPILSLNGLFVLSLHEYISNEPVSNLIQDYIKKLVIHEVDVITDSDWFSSQIDSALIALNVDKEEKWT